MDILFSRKQMDIVFLEEASGYRFLGDTNGYRFFGGSQWISFFGGNEWIHFFWRKLMDTFFLEESNGDGAAARKVYTYVCDQSLYIRLRSSTKHKQHNQYKHDALRCLLSTAAFGGQKSVYIRLRSKFIHTFTINKISKKSNLGQI